MWNANSQGGLRAYSLRNQRAYSQRTLGAVTTDIPLLRQRSRSERQLRNQPGLFSLEKTRREFSRFCNDANARGRICKSIATKATRTSEREAEEASRCISPNRCSHHPEWICEFRRRSRKLWIDMRVSVSYTIPERRYRFIGKYCRFAYLMVREVASSLCKHQVSDHAFESQVSRCSWLRSGKRREGERGERGRRADY